MNPDEDIDDLWEEIRPRPLGAALKVVPPPTTPPIPPSLVAELAAQINEKYDRRPVTADLLADCILMGIRLYFETKT